MRPVGRYNPLTTASDKLDELRREIEGLEQKPSLLMVRPSQWWSLVWKVWGLLKVIVDHIDANNNGQGSSTNG